MNDPSERLLQIAGLSGVSTQRNTRKKVRKKVRMGLTNAMNASKLKKVRKKRIGV